MNYPYYHIEQAGTQLWIVIDDDSDSIVDWFNTKQEALRAVNRLLLKRVDTLLDQKNPPLHQRGFGV